MFVREATETDLALLVDIHNSWIKSIAPEAGTVSENWAKDYLIGFGDGSPAWLFSETADSIPYAQSNLNPSEKAKRYRAELQIRPDAENPDEVFQWLLAKAEADHPDYEFWVSTNNKDLRLKEVFEKAGLRVNRYYFSLRAKVPENTDYVLPTGVSLTNLSMASDDDMKLWHEVHQDAFANHFGFIARDAESWIEQQRKFNKLPDDCLYLLKVEEEPAGIIILSDEIAHDNMSYIQLVGVKHRFQGRGLGELLIRVGMDHSKRRGYAEAELNVDTGNESGALRLYEKTGFTEATTWIQYER